MPEPIKVNRPVPQSHMASPEMDERPMMASRPVMAAPRRSSRWPYLVVILVVLLLVGTAFLFRDTFRNWLPGQAIDADKASEYQAVFLTNNQVYFGKIVKSNRDYIVLNDIYYLQVVQPPLQGSGQQAQQNQEARLSLMKLGSELHGPTDQMHINRSQVLFWEDMKESSEVVKGIREQQKQGGNGAAAGASMNNQSSSTPSPANTSGSTGTSK